jgi:hypothetical protein
MWTTGVYMLYHRLWESVAACEGARDVPVLTIARGVGDLADTRERRSQAMSTRLNVNINDETAEALRQLAVEEHTTVTEVVRRAVSVYKFFEDAKDSGQSIQLIGEDDKVTSVQLV